ncbi:hypothetical protein A6R68_23670 [Neotoma lepida]|uniref:Apolipoprotein L3 n=1 Tax=Neotoma lepida TaxID=56216 RepID=A0A1A6HWI4_NEOLE|nr:hypothetical protein A6R68_23670 [Neotoma lepida]
MRHCHQLRYLLVCEEQAALYDALKEHLAQEPTEENDGPQKELQKKKFFDVFPGLKRKLEEHIRKLPEVADHLDLLHKVYTISSVVSISSGILGLALAPFTGGASLLLSAASLGLGEAAGVTTTSSDEAEARQLVGASMDILNDIVAVVPKIIVQFCDKDVGILEVWEVFRKEIEAIRSARNIPRPAPPRTRGGNIRSLGFIRTMLGPDVYRIVTDSMDLLDVTKPESAEVLRKLAQKLKEKLHIFDQIHKALQSDLPQ